MQKPTLRTVTAPVHRPPRHSPPREQGNPCLRGGLWAMTVLLLVVASAQAEPPLSNAVIRIPSHGCSGTVIETTSGRSVILSCAHAFEGADANKKIQLDGPPQPAAVKPLGSRVRLLKVDYQADLSLLEIDNGPFACAPVAGVSYQPSRNLVSAGYDAMKYPATIRPATLTRQDRETTWTRERPWHGRSGGGLLDADQKVLIGVVSGYTGPSDHREVHPAGQGAYVSLATIHRFLKPASRSPAPLPPLSPSIPCPT